ncbi:MAG: histidinol dehydrogenase [Actinomycetota bacterium]
MRVVTLADLSQTELAALTRRSAVPDPDVRRKAAEICDEVRRRGGDAVADYAATFGGGFARIDVAQIANAVSGLDPEVRAAIDAAIRAIELFQRSRMPEDSAVETTTGVEIASRWTPLHRVGIYVPSGSAPLPSTALMTVIPARLAGVEEIVVASPAAPNGEAHPLVVAAAVLAGATEIWTLGGAQAIAALAYGAGGLGAVEKIVGPGNAWVTAAKLAVFGDVAIDLPAGPSEVLALADSTADPTLVAIDLLCQAEHGPDSPAVLVTTDPALPEMVLTEIGNLLSRLDRRRILEETLANHGLMVVADDPGAAIAFAQAYAAEHVSIHTADPEADGALITSAGSVFIGPFAAESAGDYATGANHVLPTGGLARSSNPLSVVDFGSWRQEQRVTRQGLSSLRRTITTLALAEGLDAHALAAELRFRAPL